ncbi:hypothetical protein [Nocardioides sp. KR10-350]|uniref:hypothetical protein n=1 Tax=Nocardioides cheoyonin TaxID=3156615 RepID=UPI0032B5FCBA
MTDDRVDADALAEAVTLSLLDSGVVSEDDPWLTVRYVASLFGVGPAGIRALIRVAREIGRTPAQVIEDFAKAADAGDLPPGMLDLRIFEQDEVWVDRWRTVRQIRDLADAHLLGLIDDFLPRSAPGFHGGCVIAGLADIEMDPDEWLRGTRLYRALRSEAERRCLGG